MIELLIAIFLLIFLLFTTKEGMEEDYLLKAIESIKAAMQDPRMKNSQLIELQDALSYAYYIKNIKNI
jgi:hypothetical protein